MTARCDKKERGIDYVALIVDTVSLGGVTVHFVSGVDNHTGASGVMYAEPLSEVIAIANQPSLGNPCIGGVNKKRDES